MLKKIFPQVATSLQDQTPLALTPLTGLIGGPATPVNLKYYCTPATNFRPRKSAPQKTLNRDKAEFATEVRKSS